MNFSWETWKDKGNAALERGDLDDALKNYQAGLREDPNNRFLHSNLSLVYLKKRMYQESMEAAHRAIELSNKTWAKPWYRLGQGLTALRLYPHAAAALNKAMSIEPGNGEVYKALQEMRIAQFFFASDVADKDRQRTVQESDRTARPVRQSEGFAGSPDTLR